MRVWSSLTVVVLSLVLLGGSAAQAGAPRPVLRALRGSPAGVQGAGFKVGEHVVVTLIVSARAREIKRVVAGRTGAFVARFGYEIPACTPWLVRAVGPTSGRVWYRSPVRECSPK